MTIEPNILSKIIRSNTGLWEKHLPTRIYSTLNELIEKDLKGDNEIHIFEILVRLILRADQQPASIIADLMTLIHSDDVSVLEDWTISNSGAFLKDFLQRDYVLHLFDSPDDKILETKGE